MNINSGSAIIANFIPMQTLAIALPINISLITIRGKIGTRAAVDIPTVCGCGGELVTLSNTGLKLPKYYSSAYYSFGTHSS